MIITIFIAFVSLIGLLVLHELGHFILAKRFGIKVEEFGIGYPPRLFGKKFGETLYSINLLPFGAFVRMTGETETVDDPRSFSKQPIWKRVLIALGGVFSFWVIAAVLFSIVLNMGTPIVIGDETDSNLKNPQVQIATISSGSPAEMADLKIGDTIKKITFDSQQLTVNKIKEVQEFTNSHLGQEIALTIKRGKEVFEVNLVPRAFPPEGEGPMGVSLVRTVIKSFPWYLAPWQGILATGNMTLAIIQGYGQAIKNVIFGKPAGVQLMGPIGVVHLFNQATQLGINYFLQFVGMVAIYIALFNILPIPSADGGKLLFLAIEKIRKKPIPQKIEQNITAFFFGLLILLMIFVTIKDITRIF